MNGLNDASFDWNAEHVQGETNVRFFHSHIHPTVFLHRRGKTLEGMLGVRVDDDQMARSIGSRKTTEMS